MARNERNRGVNALDKMRRAGAVQPEPTAERVAEWLARPLAELRAHFLEKRARIPRGLLPALEADSREGARQLAKRLRAHEAENRAEGQRLRHLLHFELELWERGFQRVAGVDEAGMAPLAGPVVAAAVILPKGFKLRGLDDSKKVLDPAVRERLAEQIKAEAVCWAVGMAEVEEIDRLNIYHAGLLAMRRAVEGLSPAPDYLLVDARTVPEVPMSQRGIIHGDALSASIAAASMIAKTTRDAHMVELDRAHPGWELDRHKGYPTPRHFALLKERGVSAVHRRSFRPVREALGLEPLQSELFPEPSGEPSPPKTDEELEAG